MGENYVIQLLPSLGLVGGTAVKVKILAENSKYKQIICFHSSIKNHLYVDRWKAVDNCTLEQLGSLRSPFSSAFQLYKIVKKYNAKIIHVYFPIDSFSASLVKLVCPDLKIIRSFEGEIHYVNWKKVIQNIAFSNHDEFIAISKYIKDFYEGEFRKLKEKGIRLIYNCPGVFEVVKEPIFHDVKKQCLVSVGGLNPSKNTETLVAAVKVLKEKGLDVKAFVLGDGPLRGKIEKMIEDMDLQENIELCGFCNNVTSYLDQSSIYVHTANSEGFGMAVVEAMGRYCAVVVSDSCALPELVNHGEDGLIAKTYDAEDWANKIEELLFSQEKVNEFGKKAYKKAQNEFSIDTYIKNIDNFYSKILCQH